MNLRKAHQANDCAVMQSYGFDVKTMMESTCVAELMKMYQKMTNTYRSFKVISQYNEAVLNGDRHSLLAIRETIFPTKLYRYRSFDAHWYSNIIKGKVYMGSPKNFNDPFDGNLYGYANSFYHEVANSYTPIPLTDFQIINATGITKSFSEELKQNAQRNSGKAGHSLGCGRGVGPPGGSSA